MPFVLDVSKTRKTEEYYFNIIYIKNYFSRRLPLNRTQLLIVYVELDDDFIVNYFIKKNINYKKTAPWKQLPDCQ